jgi:epoxyqueuosine reductase
MAVASTSIPSERVKALALAEGFDLAGVCRVQVPPHLEQYREWLAKGRHGEMEYLRSHLPLKEDPERLLPGARSIIAAALNYNQEQSHVPGQPRIARYALGRDYHKVIRRMLVRLAKGLQTEHPEAQFRACVDSAPIMERDFAQLAGLGWFGKNTMLINSRRGSWFFIGLLLTTLDIEPDEPAVGGCGVCTRCIEACPTGAIVHEDGRWQVDARRCVSYLTIEHRSQIPDDLEEGIGDWTFGCDVCQEVCPFNQPRPSQPERARETTISAFREGRRWPDLVQLAQVEEAPWRELARGSAVSRAPASQIRRNATINLRNRRRR